MRFEELESRVRLPIEAVRDRFRYEAVLTVLPVSGGKHGDRETLLVVTESMVAVVTPISFPRGSFMTQWAPWHAVSVKPASPRDPGPMTVRVGAREFTAHLDDGAGRRAWSDFVAAVDINRADIPRGRPEASGRRAADRFPG
jgi:hypothetical protein